jgi:radical SAM superfamily enzyme YgiQ (UPF0313 family)
MPKTVLVGINSKYIHTNLGIRYIREYLKKNKVKVEIVESSINNSISEIVREIYEKQPDIIGFSVYIWNSEYTFKIVKELKKIMKNVKIYLGGPEVSYNSKKIMEDIKEIDGIIAGSGEFSFYNLLKHGESKTEGLYYRNEKEIYYNERVTQYNIDEIPFPYTEDELKDKTKIIYYESSRGCPFLCSYCLSSIDKRVFFFDDEKVLKELKIFIDNEVKLVKFVDRTYNLNKERYMKIWRFLFDNYNEKTSFHFEISADMLDIDVIEFLQKIPKGYFQFEIGVQSSNIETLKSVKRDTDLKKLKENILKIGDNIHLHLDLIAGLPLEGLESFRESFDFVYSMKPEMVQLGFLKILKGTEMEEIAKKDGYKYSEYPPYEILENKYLTYKDIMRLKDIDTIVDNFYNSGRFKESITFIINNFYNSNFDFYNEFAEFWKEKGYNKIAHKTFSLFDYIFNFYLEKQFGEIEKFIENLKYDYLKMGKPGIYPKWYKKNIDREIYRDKIENREEFESNREAYKKSELEIFETDIINGISKKKAVLFLYLKNGVKTEVYTIND